MMVIPVGSRINTQRTIVCGPQSEQIAKGESGVVIDVDPETGDLFVRFDRYHQGLSLWRNGASLKLADCIQIKSVGWLHLCARWLLTSPRYVPHFGAGIALGLGIAIISVPGMTSVGDLVDSARAAAEAPFQIMSMAALRSTIIRGEPLAIRVVSHLQQNCHVTMNRKVINAGTKEVVYTNTKLGIDLPIGPAWVEHDFIVSLPKELPAGNYLYAGDSVSDCPGIQNPVVHFPMVPFAVVDAAP